jgi:hypothetical protein
MIVFEALKKPWKVIASRKIPFLSNMCSDSAYLKCFYRSGVHKKLNLQNPRNFNEKLQWLKIHDRKAIYMDMVDKYEAKKFVGDRIGEAHIITTYGVWDRFEDIDFDSLPNSFVLKCTHDSAGYVICRNKDEFDFDKARAKINKCLKRNFYYIGREWPYKNLKPRVIAEKYMEDHNLHELRDYKIFTFNGVPKIMHIVSNRQNAKEETYGDFFDMDYKHLDLTMGHPNAPCSPEKPQNFEKMKEFATILAEGTIHLRVDFYEVDGQLYFGELTFYQDSGISPIEPDEWNVILGDWISLNAK